MKCFEAVFGYHVAMFVKYDSVKKLTTGFDEVQKIDVSCRKTKDEILAAMCEKIEYLILDRPILIFVS